MAKDLADIGDDLEQEMAENEVCVGEDTADKTGPASIEPNSEASPQTMTTCPESTDDSAPVYRPRMALNNALQDWLSLMLQVIMVFLAG